MFSAALRYFAPAPFERRTLTVDLCVYGGVSGGVIAAVEGADRGLTVALLEPGAHVGGMTAGGLGMTDVGSKDIIGGLAREFYRRVGRRDGVAEEWRFEPHVAEEVFEEWLQAAGVPVFHGQFVASVVMEGARIASLTTVSGLTVRAGMFIDATYEGDLLARAGVSFTVGRESNDQYGERNNGQQVHQQHQFQAVVDPYVRPGTPASGLLPGIDPDSGYVQGQGDRRIQAYNFRMCLTNRPDLRLPFSRPDDYDPAQYLLLKRLLATGWNEAFHKFDSIGHGKTDTNNHGPVSTDYIGMNHAYPEADYETRERIFQAHVSWQQGLMWTLAHDREIHAAIREPMGEWGLCKDEFPATSGWPHALYVREARRMQSAYIMTEHDCRGAVQAEDPVGMAAYGMDSHNCRRFVQDGRVVNEGDLQEGDILPYPISYRAIIPRRSECQNLLVIFCLSASHIAFGSIRMEPVLMVLGQSAAIASALALAEKVAVQDLPYAALNQELRNAGQVLRRPADAKNFLAAYTDLHSI